MKITKKLCLLAIAIILTVIFSVICASAETLSGNCAADGSSPLTWTLDTEAGTLVISGKGALPEYGNVADAPWYANRAKVKYLTIEEGVTVIGARAFNALKIETLTIPTTATKIGNYAFQSCKSLKEVTISGKITGINDRAFSACEALTTIVINEGTEIISARAFQGCTSLENITIPTSVTRVGTSTSTDSVFKNCTSLKSITILNPETPIYGVLPSQEITIYGVKGDNGSCAKDYAEDEANTNVTFEYLSLEGTCGATTTWTYDGETRQLTISGQGKMDKFEKTTMPWYAYRKAIDKIVVEEGVTYIGDNAFSESSVKTVTIADSVATIRGYAFRICENLTDIKIGNGVTYIGEFAINGCKALESLVIPGSLQSFAPNAINNCKNLTSITLEEGVETLGSKAINSCTALKEIIIPASVTTIGTSGKTESAFNGCTALEKVIILSPDVDIYPKSSSAIPATAEIHGYKGSTAEAFANEYEINFVVLEGAPEPEEPEEPETPKNPSGTCGTTLTWELNPETGVLTISGIGEMDDYNNTYSLDPWHAYESNIKSIVIEDGVTTIGKYAFAKISTLESVSFPSTLTTIEDYAFRNCTSLDNLSIRGSVSFGDSCFLSCSSLKNLTLGEGITVISARVFQNCDALERVIIPASVARLGYNKSTAAKPDGTFKGCDNLKTVILLNPNTDIYPKNAKENENANPHSITFIAVTGGAVEEYATDEANGYKFVAMQGPFADDCTTVFELTAGEVKAEAGKLLPIVSLERTPLVGNNVVLNFLAVDENGALYTYSKGEALALLDANGSPIVSLENTAISIVYDDTNGTARIYVNRKIPTCGGNLAVNLPVADESFLTTKSISDSLVTADGVVCNNRFNTEVAAAEFAGFQVNTDTTAIRILAGINSLYYDKLGVTVELYCDGILQGEKTDYISVVFSSVLDDGKTVTAEELGHSYLAALKIENINRSNYSNDASVYFVVKAFSVIGDEKFEGVPQRIYIYNESDGTQAFSNYKRPYTGNDEFVPVLSFVASSDIHVKSSITSGGPERLQKAVEQINEYLRTEGVALNALVLAGDITNNGTVEQYALTGQLVENIKNTLNSQNFHVVATMGNHDYGNSNDVTLAQVPNYEANFKSVFGVEPTYSTVIGGYYFITITCDEKLDAKGDNGANMKRPYGYDYSEKTIAEAEKLIAEAYAADPEKPIFIVQHVPTSDTVLYSHENYETADGKLGKADTSDSGIPTLTELQKKYSNLVVFAGHSHAPANDVASIHQKYFTAINTGVLGGSASHSRVDGVKLSESTDPNVSYTSATNDDVFYVEVDAHNRVRIRVWDATDGKFIGETFMINSFDPDYFTYTEDRYSDDDIFFANGAAITNKTVTANSITVEFPSVPKESLAARVYKLVATDADGNEVVGYVVPSYQLDDRTTPITMTLSGLTADTEYTLEIYALNPVYSNDIADKGTVCSEAISITFSTVQ